MTTAFADAFFYFALLNRKDAAHARARSVASGHEFRTVTIAWVLTEVADGLAALRAGSSFVGLLTSLRDDPHCVIVWADATLWERGVELYQARSDKQWSLTDCISFIVMRDRGLTDALTGDHHFEQAGFRTLLKQE